MKSFLEYTEEQELEEGSGLEFLATFIPNALLDQIKKSVNKKKYIAAVDIYRKIMKDTTRSVDKNNAIKKAASSVGVNFKDLNKIVQNMPIGA